jgi:hypothetical protein
VENLNCINSYAEGCAESGVNSPNGLPKDGFWFGTGRRTLLDGCTLKRFWVEGMAIFNLEPKLYFEELTTPEVGEVVEIPIAKGNSPKVMELFSKGTEVFLSGKNGYYMVEKKENLNLTLRRQPQPTDMVGGPKAGDKVKGIFCGIAGATEDISTTITGCIFEGGTIAGMTTQSGGFDPAVRVGAGRLVMTANLFLDAKTALMLVLDEATPQSQVDSLVANNIFTFSGKEREGKKDVYLCQLSVIGATVAGNTFTVRAPDSKMTFTCLELGFGEGGGSVATGNTFRTTQLKGNVKGIGRWSQVGKMVAEGNVFDGVDAGAVDDPSANFEGKNIKLP